MNKDDRMQAAAMKVDITPKLGLPYNLGVTEVGHTIGHPLFARILYIEEAGEQSIIIATDWEGVMRSAYDALRGAVSQATGVPEQRIVANASHSHNSTWFNLDVEDLLSPLGYHLCDRDYFFAAVADIAAAARRAVDAAQPARMSYGTGAFPEFAVNRRVGYVNPRDYDRFNSMRRYPIGVTDPTLGVVRLEAANGKLLCVLHVYAAHATTNAGPYTISGSYPGTAMRDVEAALGGDCVAMFLQGCTGNVNPNPILPNHSVASVDQTGAIFARRALQVLADDVRPAEDGAFTFSSQKAELDLVPLRGCASHVDHDTLYALMGMWDFRSLRGYDTVSQLEAAFYDFADDYKAQREYRYERKAGPKILHRELIALGDRLTLAKNLEQWRQYDIQLLRCGGLSIVFLPGEVFIDYALEIRDRAGTGTVLVTGYNDCTPVYVPDPTAFEEGGYEIGPWCYSTPTTGRALVDTAAALIEQSRR
jgi:hypothetical protein